MSVIASRRKHTAARNRALQEEYKEMYQVQKLRHDYCLEMLSKKYYVSTITVQRILLLEIPEPETCN